VESPSGLLRSMKIEQGFPPTLEIETTDFHIPSAPATTANLTQIQSPKGNYHGSPVLRFLQAHSSIGKD
jgi:hypothetical protein